MKEYTKTELGTLYNGDVLEVLKQMPDNIIDCVITSPPYWALRDYGVEGQIGLEPTFQEYLEKLWNIFAEIKRILKPAGTCFVNLGDTYNGSGGSHKAHHKNDTGFQGRYGERYGTKRTKIRNIPAKSLCMIPERFAIGMIERGWILRNQIIWQKPNAMPESVKDRFTKDFEKIFFFVKQKKYYFKQQFEKAIYEGKRTIKRNGLRPDEIKKYKAGGMAGTYKEGRNKRTVWTITTKPFKEAHFAVFPPEIPEICIKAGCPENGVVLDPFMGAGTTAIVAEKLNRKWIGIELNTDYCEIIKQRLQNVESTLF